MTKTEQLLQILEKNQSVQSILNRADSLNMPNWYLGAGGIVQWYEKHFGRPIEQFRSAEEAINTWPTTATSVGVRKEKDGKLRVYARFGLDDLLGMVVRANKAQITEKIYQDKVDRWIKIWPNLKVIPWDS
ncbi:MAG: hypothetical protein A2117_02315 [Candidatus Wildermuthbacteria bacterium GWA2_46_15]|uniref:Uncharacterized protein n=1 Tax=Candidatus Wildermuthbacteria bacterium GWA2_46_15 TaxID=1802443 RepID=A0A1G2QPG3_9BACT|nr:MAG: hypothetical protein A2117_02315 [Candidatus Wildermuthbacteria bacterium GWA2_46_15]